MMDNKILKEGKLPEKDITDEKSSVKKQKTKVSFPVSDDENVRLGEMAQRAGKTKSQFMHDRVFTPETPDIILPQGDDIRVLLADISDKLTDITDILNEKHNLNLLYSFSYLCCVLIISDQDSKKIYSVKLI